MDKKKVLIIVAIVLAILVAGYFALTKLINVNTVSCTSNNTNSGVSIEQRYTIKHTKDAVTDVSIFKKFAYTDQTQFDAFKSVVVPGNDANMQKLINSNITFSSNTTGMTYSTSTTIKVSSAKDDEISQLGVDKSLNTLKTKLESQGLVCK